MIETKHIINSIQNLPIELLAKLKRLNRFVNEFFVTLIIG